jgi:DNA-damage-inducible protein D
MNEAELIFTALAELSTRQFAESVQATGMMENADAGKKGGGVARRARKDLEDKTGRKVVTGDNFLPPAQSRKIIEKKDWK